jgi:hypothetical protein
LVSFTSHPSLSFPLSLAMGFSRGFKTSKKLCFLHATNLAIHICRKTAFHGGHHDAEPSARTSAWTCKLKETDYVHLHWHEWQCISRPRSRSQNLKQIDSSHT